MNLRQALVEQFLATGNNIRFWINVQADAVSVPARMYEEYATTSMVLDIGYNMATGIPDLQVDSWGIQGTFSFDRTPFYCRLPWACVMSVQDPATHYAAAFVLNEVVTEPKRASRLRSIPGVKS